MVGIKYVPRLTAPPQAAKRSRVWDCVGRAGLAMTCKPLRKVFKPLRKVL
jgi:hypothetical protein